MLILALESAGWGGSAALLRQQELLAEAVIPPGERSAQALAPAIDRLLRAQHVTPRQLELIAVTAGPGSFTGLRVGVMTAKTLAYALGAAVLGVDTLEALAEQAAECGALPQGTGRLWCALDAQRRQVFAASFQVAAGDRRRASATQIYDQSAWLAELAPGDIVIGACPAISAARAGGEFPAGVVVAPEEVAALRATAVGRLAWRQFQAGRRDDCWSLAPQYFRPSAAEEKARAQGPAEPADPGNSG